MENYTTDVYEIDGRQAYVDYGSSPGNPRVTVWAVRPRIPATGPACWDRVKSRSARIAVDGSLRNCDGKRHGLPFRWHDETTELRSAY